MKKIFCQLCCLVLLLSAGLVSSCSNDGEITDKGFYSYSISFFHPQNIDKDYEFSFNGKTGRTGMVSRDTPEGILKVIEKESGKTVFEQQISLADNNGAVQLIKIGENINLYSTEKYISFIPTVVFSANESEYTIAFNEQVLTNGERNYISKDETAGTLKIFKSGNMTPVYTSEKMTLENEMAINLLQLDAGFVNLPEDEEPEPTVPNTAKVRFLYTGDDILTTDEITLRLHFADYYEYGEDYELPATYTLKLKKGEISDYVELDLTDPYGNYYYFHSISDASGDTIINFWDSLLNWNTPIMDAVLTIDLSTVIYKKATLQIMDGGTKMKVLVGISTLW